MLTWDIWSVYALLNEINYSKVFAWFEKTIMR
jgi:hypothetical protein